MTITQVGFSIIQLFHWYR